jgi:hypothetical protein
LIPIPFSFKECFPNGLPADADLRRDLSEQILRDAAFLRLLDLNSPT